MKTAIVTDSNSGITQSEGKEMGIFVVPMPFLINDEQYYEDINLTQEGFYEKLKSDANVSTSQPAVGELTDLWDNILKEYDELVYIPMSSGLSQSCATAQMLAKDYAGKVHVVDNQRISVTQRASVEDALKLVAAGKSGEEIAKYLIDTKFDSSIYIMLDTMKYLKKGGRVTPAAAAVATILKLKPVLQIQGEKLDKFAIAKTTKQAKSLMIEQMKKDMVNRFASFRQNGEMRLFVAHTENNAEADTFAEEIKAAFPDIPVTHIDPLSLSVSCHIGPGSLAVACARVIK